MRKSDAVILIDNIYEFCCNMQKHLDQSDAIFVETIIEVIEFYRERQKK